MMFGTRAGGCFLVDFIPSNQVGTQTLAFKKTSLSSYLLRKTQKEGLKWITWSQRPLHHEYIDNYQMQLGDSLALKKPNKLKLLFPMWKMFNSFPLTSTCRYLERLSVWEITAQTLSQDCLAVNPGFALY